MLPEGAGDPAASDCLPSTAHFSFDCPAVPSESAATDGSREQFGAWIQKTPQSQRSRHSYLPAGNQGCMISSGAGYEGDTTAGKKIAASLLFASFAIFAFANKDQPG